MIRATPKPTLFPYTTLFRSDRNVQVASKHLQLPRDLRHLLHPVLDGRDRKSTRLNSSHANISYAVFCLKKKKSNLSPIISHDVKGMLISCNISDLYPSSSPL